MAQQRLDSAHILFLSKLAASLEGRPEPGLLLNAVMDGILL